MLYPLLGTALVAVLVYLVAKRLKPKETTPADSEPEIPGLNPKNKSDGNLPDIKEAGSLHQFLTQLHKTFGAVASFWFGPTKVVSIYKPQNYKEYNGVFDRAIELFKGFEPVCGSTCIQFANGEEGWNRYNAYFRCFSEKKMRQYCGVLNKVTSAVVQRLAALPPGEQITMRKQTFQVAIKSVLLVMFGDFFENDEHVRDIAKSHDVVWRYIEAIDNCEIVEPGSDIDQEFQRSKKRMRKILRELIEWRADHPAEDEDERLLVDVLIEMHGQDEETLVADAQQLMIASVHTSGLLMYWTLCFLSKHQDIQEKAFEEINRVVGDDAEVEIKKIADLVYINQVVSEVLRCTQLATFATRAADTEMKLTDGPLTYTVPEGTPVVMALGLTFRDEELWQDPERFDPDRFDPTTYKAIPYAFEPFGFAGKRKCPGYRLGQLEATIFLVRALRHFKFSLASEQDLLAMKQYYGLVTTTQGEVSMTVEPRSAGT